MTNIMTTNLSEEKDKLKKKITKIKVKNGNKFTSDS